MYQLAGGVSLQAISECRRHFFLEMNQSAQLPSHLYLELACMLEEYRSNNPKRLVMEAVSPKLQEVGPMNFAWFHCQKAILATIHGMHHDAIQFADTMRSGAPSPFIPLDMRVGTVLCVALSAIAVARQTENSQVTHPNVGRGWRRARLRLARRYHGMLKKLSKSATDLCLGKAYLVEAELLSQSARPKDRARCLLLYKSAIGVATKAGNLLDEALANEWAAKFSLRSKKWHDKEQGLDFLVDAIDAFDRWGAVVKTRELRDQLTELRTA